MRKLLVALALVTPFAAAGQGIRKDDILLGSRGTPLTGQTVTVCTAAATGTPCSPLATIYTDATLATVATNPFTTDAFGNWGFWAAAGTYTVTFTGPQIATPKTLTVTLGTGAIVDLTGLGSNAVQTALNALVAGKTYVLPCGSYAGPTTFPSNVALVSLGGPIPNQIATLWGSTPGGSALAANCVSLTYTANLTISQAQNLKLSGITLEFTNNNAGVILTSDSFFTWDDVIINRCGSTTQQCLLLNTTGTGAGQNTENNIFNRLKINAAPTGVSGPGMQWNGSIANSAFVTQNRFYDLNIGGKLTVALDCSTNCDTNFIYGYVVNSSVAGAVGAQFNIGTPATDQDANSNIIVGYSPAAGIGTTLSFGQSTGNYVIGMGNGTAPTIAGGKPDFFVQWTGATNSNTKIYTNGNGGNVPQSAVQTIAYTNPTTTPSNITGLSFVVMANVNYMMTCNLYYQGSAGTAGLDVTITGPTAPNSVFYSYDEDATSTTVADSTASAFGTKLVGAATVTATTNLRATVTMGLRNGANAGTVQVQGNATGAGTVTVQPGSNCVLQ